MAELKLVLGTAGTGKSSRLMKEILERAQAGQKSILLVPEQFTSSTESRLYRTLGDQLSGYVESYSFSSLAEKILETYGGAAVRTLTDAGRVVLARRAADQVQDNETVKKLYGRHLHSAAFCVKCAETLNEFKSAGIMPEQLEDLGRREDVVGREKMQALSAVFAAYQGLLSGSAMDPSDRLEMAAERAQPEFFEDRAVFVDEFDTFNVPKRHLLERILEWAPSVTVVLCCDGLADYEQGTGLFSGAKQVAQTLVRMAQSQGVTVKKQAVLTQDLRHQDAPALKALTRILEGCEEEDVPQKDPSVTLLKTETRAEEAKRVVGAIQALALKGVPYSQMAIICRDMETYLGALRYELRLAQVPVFFDGATTAAQTAPMRLVRALLGLANQGLCTQQVLEVIKTGLVGGKMEEKAEDGTVHTQWIGEPQFCVLENYAYTWRPLAAQWRAPFTNAPSGFGKEELTKEDAYQLKQAESARAFLVPILDGFQKKAKECTGALELCGLIYKTMCDLGGEKRIRSMAARLAETDGIPARDEMLRSWNLTVELLDQMVLLLADEKRFDLRWFSELFELLAQTSDLGHIPQSLDSVILTTAGRMRLNEPQYCFVLGLAEGEFPGPPTENGLLTHNERESLIEQELEMPDCFENQVGRERVSFYKALTSPSKGLWLSWTAGSQALPVTSALAPVRKALDPQEPEFDPCTLAVTPAAALDLLGQIGDRNPELKASVRLALEKHPKGKKYLETLEKVSLENVFQVNDEKVMKELLHRYQRRDKDTAAAAVQQMDKTQQETQSAQDENQQPEDNTVLYLSPSNLEAYYKCPFAYFMERLVQVKPVRRAEISSDKSGTIIHYVLEKAVQEKDFLKLSEKGLRQCAQKYVNEYIKESMTGLSVQKKEKGDGQNRMRYLVSRLEKTAAGILSFVQAEQLQSKFKIEKCELVIGEKEGDLTPVTLVTEKGHKVCLVGKIDRVDSFKAEGSTRVWLRVVDYKTGSKKFKTDKVDKGANCQMLLYLFAVKNSPEAKQMSADIEPAGVLYLMADPAPERLPRGLADAQLRYPVEGLVVDEDAVRSAMDESGAGLYLSQKRGDKTAKDPHASASTEFRGLDEFKSLEKTLQELMRDMTDNLYEGQVDAQPLDEKESCGWCVYRGLCGHRKP